MNYENFADFPDFLRGGGNCGASTRGKYATTDREHTTARGQFTAAGREHAAARGQYSASSRRDTAPSRRDTAPGGRNTAPCPQHSAPGSAGECRPAREWNQSEYPTGDEPKQVATAA